MTKEQFRLFPVVVMIAGALALIGCNSTRTGSCEPGYGKAVQTQHGLASFYSVRTNHGSRTASGNRLCDEAETAAHRQWSFGTPVRVTNLKNGKSTVVRITDRGPHIRGRVIDVTVGVARRLGFVADGVVPVKIEALEEIHTPGRG